MGCCLLLRVDGGSDEGALQAGLGQLIVALVQILLCQKLFGALFGGLGAGLVDLLGPLPGGGDQPDSSVQHGEHPAHAGSTAALAGIVLDTKNFTNRTGGRTFEAAAYLRRLGADTQDVQRMFQGDLNSMIARYAIIRQAELYHDDIAVVALDEECDRVTAAKAADELLTLKGIRASFVLYRKGDGVYMSARSLGEVNVQVILEALGGGGNSTTAGGQADNITVEEARAKLLEAIDRYFEN